MCCWDASSRIGLALVEVVVESEAADSSTLWVGSCGAVCSPFCSGGAARRSELLDPQADEGEVCDGESVDETETEGDDGRPVL